MRFSKQKCIAISQVKNDGDYDQDWNSGDSKMGLDSRCVIFSLTLLKCYLHMIKHAH